MAWFSLVQALEINGSSKYLDFSDQCAHARAASPINPTSLRERNTDLFEVISRAEPDLSSVTMRAATDLSDIITRAEDVTGLSKFGGTRFHGFH